MDHAPLSTGGGTSHPAQSESLCLALRWDRWTSCHWQESRFIGRSDYISGEPREAFSPDTCQSLGNYPPRSSGKLDHLIGLQVIARNRKRIKSGNEEGTDHEIHQCEKDLFDVCQDQSTRSGVDQFSQL